MTNSKARIALFMHVESNPELLKRRVKLAAAINEQNCGFYDYAMIEGMGLKLVRKELLPKEFQ